jgi:hypothetical protein
MKMTEIELLTFLDEEADQSRELCQGDVAAERLTAQKAYMREPYGNEEEGRSAVVASSSPRPWGCFCARPILADKRLVFPTPVGVFPSITYRPRSTYRLPHARGGVS